MPKMNDLRDAIHTNAKNKGFWDKERNIAESLMLVVTELAEAVEVHRAGKTKTDLTPEIKESLQSMNDEEYAEHFVLLIKDTFEDEMADSIIRILDLCGGLNIDIDFHIQSKMKYNATRERLHGKKY